MSAAILNWLRESLSCSRSVTSEQTVPFLLIALLAVDPDILIVGGSQIATKIV
jgi:hypothetical protein